MSCPSALGTCFHLCLSVCARFVCGARARVPDMYNNATMGQGLPSGRGAVGETSFRSWKLPRGS